MSEQVTPLESKRKPKYEAKKNDAPFFVLTAKPQSLKEFEAFMDSLDFKSIATGWRDKNKKPGITFLDQFKKKVGVCICHSDDLAQTAKSLAEKFIYINGGDPVGR